MALLITYLPDEIARRRLARALEVSCAARAPYTVVAARSWSEMRDVAMRSAPQLAVFDPYASGLLDLDLCAAFHRDFPSIALLPYGDFARGGARDVLRLAQLGVCEVVVRDQDDTPITFHLRITGALLSSVPGRVVTGLGDLFPATLHPFLRSLLFRASRPLDPADAARLYYRHPNTLREHLRAAGLPPVNKLIIWARLFHAAQLLESPVRTVDNVALALDFPSTAALRNQFQRYPGVTPQEVRAMGGMVFLMAKFRERHEAGCWEVGRERLRVPVAGVQQMARQREGAGAWVSVAASEAR